MGAWGVGSFENDDAADWISELGESTGESILEEALAGSAGADGEYLESPDAACALAACEVVAAWLGRPLPSGLPDEIVEWVLARQGDVEPRLVELARLAALRVRDDSELRELWDEAEETDWRVAVDDLIRRLSP